MDSTVCIAWPHAVLFAQTRQKLDLPAVFQGLRVTVFCPEGTPARNVDFPMDLQ